MRREQTKSRTLGEAHYTRKKTAREKRGLSIGASAAITPGKEVADLVSAVLPDERELQKIRECWQEFVGDNSASLPGTTGEFIQRVVQALDGGEEFARFLEDVLGTDPALLAELEEIMRRPSLDEDKEEE